MSKLLIFAYNNDDKPHPMLSHKGWFDGKDFIPMAGSYCSGFDDLLEYDFVEIFNPDGLKHHISKRFNGNLLKEMRNAHVDFYGADEQMNLFKR